MKEYTETKRLLEIISANNVFQAKYLDGLLEGTSEEEKEEYESLLNAYEGQGDTIEHLADCYLKFIQDIMEEQFFFKENGHYRYSTAKEADTYFYQNPEYMEYYMKGLAVSSYLLDSHRKCMDWYKDRISGLTGGYGWMQA